MLLNIRFTSPADDTYGTQFDCLAPRPPQRPPGALCARINCFCPRTRRKYCSPRCQQQAKEHARRYRDAFPTAIGDLSEVGDPFLRRLRESQLQPGMTFTGDLRARRAGSRSAPDLLATLGASPDHGFMIDRIPPGWHSSRGPHTLRRWSHAGLGSRDES